MYIDCKEPSLGWLELVLRYSEADHTLDCAVVRARDLPAMDTAGLADPFCKVNIITEYGTVKQAKWFRTRTVHKTINPEFNESVRFMGVEPDELAHAMLYVVVLDDDRYGHDFLGTAKVALGPVINDAGFFVLRLHHVASVVQRKCALAIAIGFVILRLVVRAPHKSTSAFKGFALALEDAI